MINLRKENNMKNSVLYIYLTNRQRLITKRIISNNIKHKFAIYVYIKKNNK